MVPAERLASCPSCPARRNTCLKKGGALGKSCFFAREYTFRLVCTPYPLEVVLLYVPKHVRPFGPVPTPLKTGRAKNVRHEA